ncbi:hypothetical protein JIW86_39570 [Streptomyces sp. NBC_00162]|nr:hypothetical protein JIW86_39570 [Streptomyces sp. NBC_00162]
MGGPRLRRDPALHHPHRRPGTRRPATPAAAVLRTRVLSVVSHTLPDTERNLRASLISTQIVGMVMNRYIWQLGAIATLPADSVTDLLAPTIQHYLADPLPSNLSDSQSPG